MRSSTCYSHTSNTFWLNLNEKCINNKVISNIIGILSHYFLCLPPLGFLIIILIKQKTCNQKSIFFLNNRNWNVNFLRNAVFTSHELPSLCSGGVCVQSYDTFGVKEWPLSTSLHSLPLWCHATIFSYLSVVLDSVPVSTDNTCVPLNFTLPFYLYTVEVISPKFSV